MKAIRTHAHPGSQRHGVILSFAVTFVLIAGLLAMHTMMSDASPHAHGVGAAVTTSAMDMNASAAAVHADTPGGASDDSMLVMMCALALLAAAIILVGPGVLGRAAAPPGTFTGLLTRARALAWPDPPSLHVLSISRT